MLGAALSHLLLIGGMTGISFVLMLVLGILAYGRRERMLRLLGR